MRFQRFVPSLFFQIRYITFCPFLRHIRRKKTVLARYHVLLLMGFTEFIMSGLRLRQKAIRLIFDIGSFYIPFLKRWRD